MNDDRKTFAKPAVTLTRADKERAVVQMAMRLELSANDFGGFATADHRMSEELILTGRACRRRRAALLRLAMARTVDG